MSVDGAKRERLIGGAPYSGAGESLITISLPPGTPAEAETAVRRLVELTGILARRCAQLQQALDSRVVIEQAKGILSERYSMPKEDAFEALRRTARSNRIKLRDVAEEVVTSAQTPAILKAHLDVNGFRSAASARRRARIQVHPRS